MSNATEQHKQKRGGYLEHTFLLVEISRVVPCWVFHYFKYIRYFVSNTVYFYTQMLVYSSYYVFMWGFSYDNTSNSIKKNSCDVSCALYGTLLGTQAFLLEVNVHYLLSFTKMECFQSFSEYYPTVIKTMYKIVSMSKFLLYFLLKYNTFKWNTNLNIRYNISFYTFLYTFQSAKVILHWIICIVRFNNFFSI